MMDGLERNNAGPVNSDAAAPAPTRRLLSQMERAFSDRGQKKGDDTVRKLVEVGRNDPCPCGSGKKYKKCCSRVNPDHSEEYYLNKLKDAENMEELYNRARQAEENHPLNPRFTWLLGVYNLENRNTDLALQKLLKLWKLIGTRMSARLVTPLAALLLMEGRLQTAEEILDQKTGEEKTPDLLLQLSMVKVYKDNPEQALKLASQAGSREQEVNNKWLWVSLLQELVSREYILEGLKLWYNNRSQFSKDQDTEGPGIIDRLQKLLQSSFGFSEEEVVGEKLDESVKKLIGVLEGFRTFETALQEGRSEKAEKQIEKIKDLADDNFIFMRMIFRALSELEEWDQMLELTDLQAENTETRIFSARYRALALRKKQQLQAAEDSILEGIELLEQVPRVEPWSIFGEYLMLVLNNEQYHEKLPELLEKLRTNTSSQHNDLELVVNCLESYPVQQLLDAEENLLMVNKELNIFDQEELYVNYFYRLLLLYDAVEQEDRDIGITRAVLKKKAQAALKIGEENAYLTPLLEYGEFVLRAEELKQQEKEQKIEEMMSRPCSFKQELLVKYEAVLKYGQQEEWSAIADPRELLDRDEHLFYEIIFHLQQDNYEQAEKLMGQLENTAAIYSWLNEQGSRFIDRDKLEKLMEILQSVLMSEDNSRSAAGNDTGDDQGGSTIITS